MNEDSSRQSNRITQEANSPVSIELKESTLIAEFPSSWNILSWAPFNGGWRKSTCIFNHKNEKFRDDEMDGIFKEVVRRYELPSDSVGMLTGADVKNYSEAIFRGGPFWVHAIATLGFSNARSIGDPADLDVPTGNFSPGTINLIIACNALPDLYGNVEAVHMATMAKTYALMKAGILSKKTGRTATGTGTDCIAIASSGEIKENYCGMHTQLGELIGKSVCAVVKKFLSKNMKNLEDGSFSS